LDIAEQAKRQNIIDMALTFTAMMRLFSKGSKNSIAKRFESFCASLKDIYSAESYDKLHQAFCAWFSANIRRAQRILKNKKTEESASASYGQGAKVLDIAAKVYVHYCKLPDAETAQRISPFLHGAIDTQIMNYLKQRYPKAAVAASTIGAIDEKAYRALQDLIACDIKETFHSGIHAVQYDDIMWNRLNKKA
jgi:hypothetical protein